MKILIVHPSVELYGADKILLYILEFLHEKNDITVLLPKNGILVTYIEKISSKIKIDINERLPIVHSKIRKIDLLTLPLRVKGFQKIYKKNSFDIVYCNTLSTVMLLYTNWAKRKVIHVHEIIENKILNIGFSILISLKTRNVICVSKHVKNHLLCSKKYTVIHNGIPDMNKDVQVKPLEDKLRFVLPGRYMPKKGQWFLVDTIKQLSENQRKQCEFYLYGSPPPNRLELLDELKNLLKENNIENIKLFGFKENIQEIYTNADVLLVPSLMADPFPTTVLEAMMYSKPLITTNNGGASEIVNDSFGFLIRPGNVEEFKTAILFYLNNKEKIHSMGISARGKFTEYLTLEAFKERFMKFFIDEWNIKI